MSRKKSLFDKKNLIEIGSRIKEIREMHELNQAEFGKSIGISGNYMSDLELGKAEPSGPILLAIEYRYSVKREYILYGKKTAISEPVIPYIEIKKANPIPVVGIVPAGFPEMPPDEDKIIDYLYLPDVSKNAYAMMVTGESMSPTVKSGDYAIFEMAGQNDIKSGDLIIVKNEWNELILKRYRKKDDKVYLTSDNPEYQPITPNEQYKIIGKVIKVIRDIKF